jgi:hypothetical protein
VLDAAAFVALHPEFRTCPGAPGVSGSLLVTTLTMAAARIDATVFGALTDEAHGWLAADLLACSPWGRNAKLAPEKGGPTMYAQKHRELVALVGSGYGLT